MRTFVVLTALVLAAGCKRAPTATGAVDRPQQADDIVAWHSAGQLCFPARIGRWTYSYTHDYGKKTGNNRSFHYDLGPAFATFYVYPPEGEPEGSETQIQAEMKIVAAQVQGVEWRQHANLKLDRWQGEGHLVVGYQEVEIPNSNRLMKAQTLAMVHKHGPWIVKLRLTWTTGEDWRPLFEELIEGAALPCRAPSKPSPSEQLSL